MRDAPPPITLTRVPMDDACARHITRDGRIGEVCMVLRRPDGRIWCAAKTFYPNHISRLLTGGIHPHEAPAEALLREIAEETSLKPLTITPGAEIHYDAVVPFVTHLYICTVENHAPVVVDESERIHHFDALLPHECGTRALQLNALPETFHPDIGTTWRAWGAFRAHSHRVVADWFAAQSYRT